MFTPSMTRDHGRHGVRRDTTPAKIETIIVVADPTRRATAAGLIRDRRDIFVAADDTEMGPASKGVHQVIFYDDDLQMLHSMLARKGAFGSN